MKLKCQMLASSKRQRKCGEQGFRVRLWILAFNTRFVKPSFSQYLPIYGAGITTLTK